MECKDCPNYYSCQYMQHRFAVRECEEHDMQVLVLHSLELADRKEILRECKNIWIKSYSRRQKDSFTGTTDTKNK